MGYLTIVVVAFSLFCCNVNADQCTSRGGQCKDTSSGWFWSRKPTCSNGRFVSNLCPGPSNIKCCVPNTPAVTTTTTNSKCTAREGQCKRTSSGCSNGRFISNLCSGPSNIKCCVPNTPIRTPSSSSGSYQCYGDFMKLNPSGAGKKTSKGLRYTGVRASNKMLDDDLAELKKRKQCYIQAADNNCIHPAVIAAIASRESRGGRLLYKTNGLGDRGNGWGIMQCDLNTSGQNCKKYKWDSCEHINHMTQTVLVPFIKTVKRDHPNWDPEVQLKGGVAAYNFGNPTKNVKTISGMDKGTTGDDYSGDVIARAQRLVSAHGW